MTESVLIESLPLDSEPLGPVEYVILDWDRRRKARQKCYTDHGTEISIALPRGHYLHSGTLLFNSCDRTIFVKAQSQPVIRISPADSAQACKVAHHAGNWHRSVQLTSEGLLIVEEDGPLQQWLQHNKIEFELLHLPFEPNLRGDAHD